MSVSSRRGECLPDDISRDWETMKTFTGSYANRQTRRTANGLKIQGITADTVCVDIRTLGVSGVHALNELASRRFFGAHTAELESEQHAPRNWCFDTSQISSWRSWAFERLHHLDSMSSACKNTGYVLRLSLVWSTM